MHTLQLYTLLALRFGQPEALDSHGLKPDETSGQLGSGPYSHTSCVAPSLGQLFAFLTFYYFIILLYFSGGFPHNLTF